MSQLQLKIKNCLGRKQKYMYVVFEKTLLTDKGKALVRAHQKTYNAQLIYKELQDYALLSTKATMDASKLLSYITTLSLGDGKWKGSTHVYILHWQDQVCKYHNLHPSHMMSNDILRTLLENTGWSASYRKTTYVVDTY